MTCIKDLLPCFQGIMPSIIATCGLDGEPNATYLSQVYYVDERHVALSCQFFNKTRRNVDENPYANVMVHDPVDFRAWRLQLRFLRSEFAGPLFDTMALRIQIIASHTGMAGVFKLLSADVYEVLSVEAVDGFLLPPDPVLDVEPPPLPSGPLTELRGVQVVSERIARARDLESLLAGSLEALDELLGFSHSMILIHEEPCGKLVAIAGRGYGNRGAGAEVAMGSGLIGTVAQHRRMVRVAGVGSEIRYGRAIRGRIEESGGADRLAPEIPLPGLPDAQAQLALPLLVGERLLGVLAVESRDPLCFDEWDEAFLQILGNQIALGIDRMQDEESVEISGPKSSSEVSTAAGAEPKEGRRAPRTMMNSGGARAAAAGPRRSPNGDPHPAVNDLPVRTFTYFVRDECIFVGEEYLIRSLPARIFWKILELNRKEGRREFTNRELRLDPALGLPPLKDNLESRLILLRKRLAEKCPEVSLSSLGRGRFGLGLRCAVAMIEKD